MLFSIPARLKSFVHAFRGARWLVSSQHNARVHLAATLAVAGLGLAFRIALAEWVAVTLCLGMVWTAEAINTAIELLGDEISLERRERIGQAKDVAAFAVLASAAAAAVVGTLIFGPRLCAAFMTLTANTPV